MNLFDIRKEYILSSFDEKIAEKDPFLQFKAWFTQAKESQVNEPTAMSLATVDEALKPSLRIVLLKEVSNKGFVFFTNYASRKGKSLALHPDACLNFFWPELERQVRIEGRVEKISPEESDAYFYSRPLGSQKGAIASPQSQEIESREVIEQKIQALNTLADSDIKRPEHWGGYVLVPTYFEFWQGRESRLHDRIAYTLLNENVWKIKRLAP